MRKPRPKRSVKLPVADRRSFLPMLLFIVLVVFVAGAGRWYADRPQPSAQVEVPANSDRVCLVLSPLAPDSDMSELDSEFKSLQRRSRVFSVRRSEWDDAGDRLRSYFNIINCE